MTFDPKKAALWTVKNVKALLLYVCWTWPTRTVLVMVLWTLLGLEDYELSWNLAAFLAFLFPLCRPHLMLNYNTVHVKPEDVLRAAWDQGTAGKPH